MFGARFWGNRYFGGNYWGHAGLDSLLDLSDIHVDKFFGVYLLNTLFENPDVVREIFE